MSSSLPYNWANWKEREACRYGGGAFISWAEEAPQDPTAYRYAVARDDSGGVRWWQFSPNPDISPLQSMGCFYGDAAEKNAAEAAMTHKKSFSPKTKSNQRGRKMETPEVTSKESSSLPVQLSKREIVVDLMGRLDMLFADLHNSRDRMLNSAQNLRESRRLLDASVEGKSLDDAPDAVEEFLYAVKAMHECLDPMVEQMEQFEAATSQVLVGARSL